MTEREPELDPELDPTERARLTELLSRAAADVAVPPTPSMPEVDTHHGPSTPPRERRRAAPLLAAAALVLIAGLGTWWALGDDGTRQVDSGPADDLDDRTGPPVTVSPTVIEQSGVWRLPEGLDDYELVGVQETGISMGWGGTSPGRLAVDDPDDPRRWLLVEAYNQFGVAPADAQDHQLSAEVVAFTVRSTAKDGAIWFQVDPVDDAFEASTLSGAVRGVDEAELVEALTAAFARPGDLIVGDGIPAAVEELTARVGLTDGEVLDWTGGENELQDTTGGGVPSVELTLTGAPTDEAPPEDASVGPEVVVTIAGTDGAPTWAQMLRFVQQADLSAVALSSDLEVGMRYETTRRPDLGRNVLEVSSSHQGMPTVTSLLVFSDDGVMISAGAATVADPRDPARSAGIRPPFSTDQQLRIINSLRTTGESEFRARAEQLGAVFLDAGTASEPTTTLGIEAPEPPG